MGAGCGFEPLGGMMDDGRDESDEEPLGILVGLELVGRGGGLQILFLLLIRILLPSAIVEVSLPIVTPVLVWRVILLLEAMLTCSRMSISPDAGQVP